MAQRSSTPLNRWLGELRRRKVVRVAAVYVVVAWLLIQVAETTFQPMGLPGRTVKLVISLAILGFPLAWAFDLTPEGLERTPQLGQDGNAAAHSEKAVPSTPTETAPAESVAILPKRNGTGDARDRIVAEAAAHFVTEFEEGSFVVRSN